jgi:predicted peptidase
MAKRLLFLLIFCGFILSCKKEKTEIPKEEPPIPEDPIETEPVVLTKVKKRINSSFTGYYEALPANYSKTTSKYPVLIYIHGLGQRGDGTTQLDFVGIDGLGSLLEKKSLPPNFNVNGRNFSFIYICPQYWSTPTADEVKSMLDTMLTRYRIDTKRIYLSGLSVGGVVATEAAAKYPKTFAAIAPHAGTTHSAMPGDFTAKCKAIAQSNLPIWAVHNEFDPTIPKSDTEEFIKKVNSFNPPIRAKYTMFPGQRGHNAWARALDPNFREDSKNLYEWMLQYSR